MIRNYNKPIPPGGRLIRTWLDNKGRLRATILYTKEVDVFIDLKKLKPIQEEDNDDDEQ